MEFTERGAFMTEKKKISVQIEGRSYSLITSDDEKYVESVADEVINHIRNTISTGKNLDTRDCAVLAALDFCDDRNKAMKKNKDYVTKADKIIRQTADLNKLCVEYKERLAEAINENTALLRKYKRLEKENERLREALAKSMNGAPETDPAADDEAEAAEFASMQQYSLFDMDYDK